MQQQFATIPARPSRAQIEPAALELLSRHSAGLLATARRYSQTPEDAEDAYQRGVEILLTKAPTTSEAELLPWAKTVVKHEAFAVAKSSGRLTPTADGLAGEADPRGWTEEQAERYEQLRVGAEAMAGLKPQEIRCLLLRAEGLSYQEICAATGWTYTKVNRCLTEGRRSFLSRVAGIESGAECERLAPLISKVADGEAAPEEMRRVRPHLKGCLACKATLREYRATPSRVAGLVPPVAALAGGGSARIGMLDRLLERFAGVGDAAGAKVAAVMAAGVVLAGGSAAGIDAIHHDTPPVAPSAYEQMQAAATSAQPNRVQSDPTPATPASSPPDPSAAAMQAAADADRQPAATPATPTTTTRTAATPAPKAEFDPGTAADPPTSPTAPAPRELGAGSGPGTRRVGTSGRGGSASGEFLP